MLTTCPECHTTFRVTQEHLGLRRGLVRCGTCGVVFNAYDSLLAELVAPPALADAGVDTAPAAIEPPAPETRADEASVNEVAVPVLAVAAPPREPAPPVVQAVHAVHAASEETSESILLSELPTPANKRRAAPPRSFRFILQFLAALFLGGLLLLQLLVFFRADLAAALPATRPLLKALCRPLGCTVPLPRQLDKKAIAASSLEHDAENKARARLTVLLINRSGKVQAWPHVVLTLTDVRDAPVAQRVFAPAEYLPKTVRAAGIGADGEQELRLDLDTGTLAATGYALDLAYR